MATTFLFYCDGKIPIFYVFPVRFVLLVCGLLWLKMTAAF